MSFNMIYFLSSRNHLNKSVAENLTNNNINNRNEMQYSLYMLNEYHNHIHQSFSNEKQEEFEK
jgi:hypothetical protein